MIPTVSKGEMLSNHMCHNRGVSARCYTYLKPAMTQEEAAEALDVPFSTYRRHLKAGMLRVTDLLWQKEIRGGTR